ncbi:hypothetical protein [Rubinisphaera margarita]|uniref:hypothetical protein n=1 Tax=Rubinisphaera margarita TaxID=2909586 RepID=UPI001EE93AE2|nr:hypothetical protein [Rubinisphaera margarita]MCG6158084.1 hypothetical protein [Rubinisphaera margarita]
MSVQAARFNPFATEHLVKIRYQFETDSLEGLIGQLDAMNRRAALVGPEGHGKTTLQREIAAHYESRGVTVHWIRLTRDRRVLPTGAIPELRRILKADDLLCVDGAEQMNWWTWRKLIRSLPAETGCLITTHQPGLLPTLRQCETTPELLDRIVAELLRSGFPDWKIPTKDVFARHRGDLRLCLFELYDAYASGELHELQRS